MDAPERAVQGVLADYLRRGVFNGLTSQPGRQGKVVFHFEWAYQQPYTLALEPSKNRLVFEDFLPRVDAKSLFYKELKAFIQSRSDDKLPLHRRLEAHRLALKPRLSQGVVDLEMAVLDGDFRHATQKMVNMAHEIFLFLNEYWADYMSENFHLNVE
jgi:hypothetical protein